jgi:hypothetical protein
MLAYGSHLGRWKGVPPLTILNSIAKFINLYNLICFFGSYMKRTYGVPPLTIIKYQQQNENELNKKRADPIEPALYINL